MCFLAFTKCAKKNVLRLTCRHLKALYVELWITSQKDPWFQELVERERDKLKKKKKKKKDNI